MMKYVNKRKMFGLGVFSIIVLMLVCFTGYISYMIISNYYNKNDVKVNGETVGYISFLFEHSDNHVIDIKNPKVVSDEDGKLLRTGEVSCETKTAGKYDSVTVYLDDQSETTKFVWVTINGLEVFSDTEQFVRRMNFEYELMFKFDTESLEIFDIQKSGNNQVGL